MDMITQDSGSDTSSVRV